MLSAPGLADKFALDVNSANALRAGARQGDEAALRAAAKEFEAMVVNIMLKTMRQTHLNDAADDPFGGETVRMYQEMLDQQWSQKMAETKGFGFADMLLRQLDAAKAVPSDQPAGTAAAAGLPFAPAGDQAKAGLPIAPQPETENETGAGMPSPAAVPAPQQTDAAAPAADYKRAFIERLRPHAEAAARATGVPAEYILAHAALESGWGRREIAKPDGSASHNLFGIKAGANWQGESAEVTTTEYRYGLPMKRVDRFRAYGGYDEAFTDYARLIRGRYANALSDGDARSFAFGLQAAGYATDPRYGEKLLRVIQGLT